MMGGGSSGTGMLWWSEKAVSFKINRKSEAASVVKSSISSKLPDFLSDYSDEVLAEYITVLVCNGKDQYQARDDLEAFLGERTADFVSWLWGLLFNHARHSNSDIIASSDPIYVASVTSKNDHDHAHPFSLTKNDEVINAGQESIQSRNKSNTKVVNCESNPLPNKLLQPKSDKTPSTQLKSSPSENAHPRHISATATSLSAQHAGVVSHSHHYDRPRGSVWDRLGKPCDDAYEGSKIVDVSGVGFVKQDEQILNSRPSIFRVSNGEQNRTITGEFTSGKLEHVVGTKSEPHVVSNIKRKRHFGEIKAGLGADSVPMVGERNVNLQCRENSQDFKKSNLTKDSKITTPNLAPEKGVGLVENEVTVIGRYAFFYLHKFYADYEVFLQIDGSSRLLEDDSESRTVLVTNVHFAATKEALSSYFDKCGVVVNLEILIDKATAQPKGSASVTFASKDSVDKALELSGTTFFSRTIKVLRKVEAAASTTGPAQLAGWRCQSPLTNIPRNFIPNKLNCLSPHLQWRRVSISAPSAPTNDKMKGVVPSTFQLQLPSSPASVKTREVNSLSIERHTAS
uniref:RRM domain-containing protein n=1 Tax=Fagus sylvatica TaxID=28930 RepID=A0A2N9J6N8_FAGSY